MKNILSAVKENLWLTFLIVLFFITIGYWYYEKFVEPNQIQQEVTVMSMSEQLRQYEIWDVVNGFQVKDGKISISKEKNPFGDFKKPCYVLYTKLGDNYDYDYGTEEEILAKKCERYSEYEKSRAKFLADKEAEELAIEKKEQEQEDALDRLNEKSCN